MTCCICFRKLVCASQYGMVVTGVLCLFHLEIMHVYFPALAGYWSVLEFGFTLRAYDLVVSVVSVVSKFCFFIFVSWKFKKIEVLFMFSNFGYTKNPFGLLDLHVSNVFHVCAWCKVIHVMTWLEAVKLCYDCCRQVIVLHQKQEENSHLFSPKPGTKLVIKDMLVNKLHIHKYICLFIIFCILYSVHTRDAQISHQTPVTAGSIHIYSSNSFCQWHCAQVFTWHQ